MNQWSKSYGIYATISSSLKFHEEYDNYFIIDNPINGSLGGYDYELKD